MIKHNKLNYLLVFMLLLTSCKSVSVDNSNDEDPIVSEASQEDFVTNVSSLVDFNFTGTIEDTYICALFRNKKQITFEDVNVYEESRYLVSNSNEYIKVKEIILEPLKISADYAPSEAIIISKLDTIKLCTDEIDKDVLDVLSKVIPINATLSSNADVPYEDYDFPSGKMVSVWFYPICYEVTYGEDTYRILKVESGNELNKLCSDGVYELRFYDYDE